jgi:dishevelled associated activator of morphogenesis
LSNFQFDRVCKLFCEDPVTTQSDEFFGIFDLYVTSFQEAKQENDAVKRKREEEEKIAKQQQEVWRESKVFRFFICPYLS